MPELIYAILHLPSRFLITHLQADLAALQRSNPAFHFARVFFLYTTNEFKRRMIDYMEKHIIEMKEEWQQYILDAAKKKLMMNRNMTDIQFSTEKPVYVNA